MQVIYSGHAKRRMRQRGITDSDVRACLGNPQLRIVSGESTVYQGGVGSRTLKVMVASDRDTDAMKFVITTVWRGDDDDD
ncbi:DUF4258 domain-containing protein [Amycolatopsis orientalis]|uniref:DUF4258 domain-containing protein n=1 Tax=Amycolatopsis orientalis TaxID=31958 RepID=UPI0009DEBA0E